jgi:hypothetical protein
MPRTLRRLRAAWAAGVAQYRAFDDQEIRKQVEANKELERERMFDLARVKLPTSAADAADKLIARMVQGAEARFQAEVLVAGLKDLAHDEQVAVLKYVCSTWPTLIMMPAIKKWSLDNHKRVAASHR